jgi:hypothetical protein
MLVEYLEISVFYYTEFIGVGFSILSKEWRRQGTFVLF